MWRSVAVVGAGALLASGCGAAGGGDSDGGAGRPSVVAAFFPLADAAAQVGGERITVTDLTPAGAEPHDLELTTDQVDAIEDADVVVYLGRGFQPAVEEAAGRTGGARVDALDGEDGDDPHVWLDPRAMRRLAERLRDALATVDPSGAAAYRSAASSYLEELDALDREFVAGLGDCDRRVVVTAHEAFDRLAGRYDLETLAITGRAPESEADPRRLAALADEVRAKGVTTVLAEPGRPAGLAETLAREAGLRTAVLDPVETRRDAAATYLSVMREDLRVLRAALGCR